MRINIPILFVTGLPCSGKSEFLNVARSMPLLCVEWSQFFKEILNNFPQTENREGFLNLIKQIVKEKGINYFPGQILLSIDKQIKNSPDKYKGVVISGARNPNELCILAKSFTKSLVVVLCADYHTRYQRAEKRARTNDSTNIKDFIWNDFAELHTGLAEIANKIAKELIFNDTDFNEFKAQVEEFLRKYFQMDNRSMKNSN